MDMESGIQIDELRRMLRRRAGLVAAVAGGVLLLAIFVAAILPNEYRASATLLVEPQVISERLVESGLEESDLTNRLHIMTMEIRSRSRLSRVIDDLGLYEEMSNEMTREQVIDYMNDRINVEPVLPELATEQGRDNAKINTFTISFRSESPQTAAEVANRLANDFIEQHIEERVQASGETSEFLQSELDSLSQQIAQVEDRIAQVKSENAGSLPEDLRSNRDMLSRASQNLRSAEQDLALARSDAAFYRQQVGAAAGKYRRGEEDVSPARRLQMLELELSELRAKGFTDKHPDVIDTRREIASLREAIESGEAEVEARKDEEEALSPIQQTAQAEARRAELRAEAAKEEIARLEEQVAEYERRIAATPRVEEQLAVLQSRRESLMQSYQDYASRLQQASVAASMQRRQKGEKFRVLSTAYPPPVPASPNRPLIVALGLVLGLAAGAGLAVLLEATDTSFHDARSLQSAIGVPVLGSVPPILFEMDRKRMRRRRLRNAVAAATLAGVVLGASLVGNWMVNGAPEPVAALLGGSPAQAETSGPGGAGE